MTQNTSNDNKKNGVGQTKIYKNLTLHFFYENHEKRILSQPRGAAYHFSDCSISPAESHPWLFEILHLFIISSGRSALSGSFSILQTIASSSYCVNNSSGKFFHLFPSPIFGEQKMIRLPYQKHFQLSQSIIDLGYEFVHVEFFYFHPL
jgi:hypothetical protein